MCSYYVPKFTLYSDNISREQTYFLKLREDDKRNKGDLLSQKLIR